MQFAEPIQIAEPDMTAVVTTDSLLAQIAADLYRLAAGRPPLLPLPMPVIAAPAIATGILRDETAFAKEYRFLEMLARGRFSTNGGEWRRRAALTQPFYRAGVENVSEAEIAAIYRRSLLRRIAEPERRLFQCFLDAAVHVMSRALGLQDPLPWPAESATLAREVLRIPLCFSLCGHAARSSAEVCQTLAGFFQEVEREWMRVPEVRALLRDIEARVDGVQEFNAVGELIQNVMAASETTASALLWAVESLARFTEPHDELDPSRLQSFLDEVLRLFPPIPMVMRRCQADTTIAGMRFSAEEVYAISFVGLHCHPEHWSDPFRFDPGRTEWAARPTERVAYYPFSTGPRLCGGARLATAELVAGLHVFLDLFRVDRLCGPIGFDYGLTSRPTARVEACVVPRHPLPE